MLALSRVFASFKEATFSVAEAAAICEVPQKQVNQYIERDLSGFDVTISGDRHRLLTRDGLIGIRVAHDYAQSLQSDYRIAVIQTALSNPRKRNVELNLGKIIVRLDVSREAVKNGLAAYHASRRLISSRDDILSGEPCISGTRISAYNIAALVESDGELEVRNAYPQLILDEIRAACFFAATNPRRGRPPKSIGAKLVNAKKRRKTRSVKVT